MHRRKISIKNFNDKPKALLSLSESVNMKKRASPKHLNSMVYLVIILGIKTQTS